MSILDYSMEQSVGEDHEKHVFLDKIQHTKISLTEIQAELYNNNHFQDSEQIQSTINVLDNILNELKEETYGKIHLFKCLHCGNWDHITDFDLEKDEILFCKNCFAKEEDIVFSDEVQ